MFKKLFNIDSIKNAVNTTKSESIYLQQELSTWNKKANKIQSNFNFHIPDYIIDEIIESEDSKSFVNLHYLINCALVNERIAEDNAKILKQVYSFK